MLNQMLRLITGAVKTTNIKIMRILTSNPSIQNELEKEFYITNTKLAIHKIQPNSI